MDDETRIAIQQLAKKALQNQAHIMTILRLMAIKRMIDPREFDDMYSKTLKELKEDVVRGLLARQDRDLSSLFQNLGNI